MGAMNRRDLVQVGETVVLYGVLVLAFTLLSLYVSPLASQTGTFRALDAIPLHLAALAGAGLVLGLIMFALFRRLDIVLAIVGAVVLTDLDHLPSALDVAQPVRPAHSFVFIVVAFVAVATIIRRVDLSFAVMSGFFTHLAIDTGVFPPLAPLSYSYYDLSGFQVAFVVLAVGSALVAGYLGKRMAQENR